MCKKNLLIWAFVLGLLIVFVSLLSVVAEAGGPTKFYLAPRSGTVLGDGALQACAKGFHMASLWEIHEPSNLSYDTTLGRTTGDSGFGPPSLCGWIRTGSDASGQNNVGSANCNAWTSKLSTDWGTEACLPFSFWDNPSSVISPWFALTEECNTASFVWCVED